MTKYRSLACDPSHDHHGFSGLFYAVGMGAPIVTILMWMPVLEQPVRRRDRATDLARSFVVTTLLHQACPHDVVRRGGSVRTVSMSSLSGAA